MFLLFMYDSLASNIVFCFHSRLLKGSLLNLSNIFSFRLAILLTLFRYIRGLEHKKSLADYQFTAMEHTAKTGPASQVEYSMLAPQTPKNKITPTPPFKPRRASIHPFQKAISHDRAVLSSPVKHSCSTPQTPPNKIAPTPQLKPKKFSRIKKWATGRSSATIGARFEAFATKAQSHRQAVLGARVKKAPALKAQSTQKPQGKNVSFGKHMHVFVSHRPGEKRAIICFPSDTIKDLKSTVASYFDKKPQAISLGRPGLRPLETRLTLEDQGIEDGSLIDLIFVGPTD